LYCSLEPSAKREGKLIQGHEVFGTVYHENRFVNFLNFKIKGTGIAIAPVFLIDEYTLVSSANRLRLSR
jgi:hypothetical protein